MVLRLAGHRRHRERARDRDPPGARSGQTIGRRWPARRYSANGSPSSRTSIASPATFSTAGRGGAVHEPSGSNTGTSHRNQRASRHYFFRSWQRTPAPLSPPAPMAPRPEAWARRPPSPHRARRRHAGLARRRDRRQRGDDGRLMGLAAAARQAQRVADRHDPAEPALVVDDRQPAHLLLLHRRQRRRQVLVGAAG